MDYVTPVRARVAADRRGGESRPNIVVRNGTSSVRKYATDAECARVRGVVIGAASYRCPSFAVCVSFEWIDDAGLSREARVFCCRAPFR